MTDRNSSTPSRSSNLAAWMDFLVYGKAVLDPDRHGFQAWFWIDVPGHQPERVFPLTRAGDALFETAELAEAAGVKLGLKRARELSGDRFT